MSNNADGSFDSPYGTVKMSYPGPRNRYGNVQRYNQSTGNYIELQGPALRALKEAEERSTPKRLLRKGRIEPIRVTGHGGRDYAYQAELYAREPGRFADPDSSQHVEFLACDFNIPWYRPIRWVQVRRALKSVGFIFTVSGELWHGSFRMGG
jgi:hypothetical protein